MKFVINHLPSCLSNSIKALFVFRTQFKIFLMRTGRLVTVTNDRSEARVDPLAALFVQGQTGKYQAEVSGAT